MKALLLIIVVGVLGFWLFQKNGFEVFRPLPTSTSTSTPVTSSPLINISTTSPNITLQILQDKLKDWGKDVNILGGFEKASSSPMNENFSTHMASFNFPKSYLTRSVREAVVDVGVGESFCTPTFKTGETLTPAGQKTIAGFLANKYTWFDAAAGNQYQGTVYSYKRDDKCYAISLFLHTTTAENYASNETESTQFRAEHDAAVKKIMDKFESIISFLAFTS